MRRKGATDGSLGRAATATPRGPQPALEPADPRGRGVAVQSVPRFSVAIYDRSICSERTRERRFTGRNPDVERSRARASTDQFQLGDGEHAGDAPAEAYA